MTTLQERMQPRSNSPDQKTLQDQVEQFPGRKGPLGDHKWRGPNDQYFHRIKSFSGREKHGKRIHIDTKNDGF